jgi:hypothetical protein
MDRFSAASLIGNIPLTVAQRPLPSRNSATQNNNLKFYNELARKGVAKEIKTQAQTLLFDYFPLAGCQKPSFP